MNFKVLKTKENLLGVMRHLGYHPDRRQKAEPGFSRPLAGGQYPKFHIYVEDTGDGWILKLHLDQKKPSYEGAAAHSGEYEGPLVEQEIERIKSLF